MADKTSKTRPKRLSLAGAGLLVLLGLLVWVGVAGAQQDWRYFPETGFWVGGEFLVFYENRGGLEIFGYPIGNATTEEEGRTVQYFQRVRMELHLNDADPYRVQLGLLGWYLHGPPDLPVPLDRIPAQNDPRARYFQRTGQVVGGAFWDLYRTRGGLDIFGYPLTGEFVENGVPVQYFQRARMEWRAENPDPYKVQLGLLGQEWLAQQPNPDSAPTVPPTVPLMLTPLPTPTGTPSPAPSSMPTPPLAGGSSPPKQEPWTLVALLAVLLAVLLVVIVLGRIFWRTRRSV